MPVIRLWVKNEIDEKKKKKARHFLSEQALELSGWFSSVSVSKSPSPLLITVIRRFSSKVADTSVRDEV